MARQIKVTEIDDIFKDLVVHLVQATTLEGTARVKNATPVFSLDNYPDLDSIVCITTDESRSTRKTFKPHQLEIIP